MDKPTDWGRIKFLSKCALALILASALAECGANHRPTAPPISRPSEPSK